MSLLIYCLIFIGQDQFTAVYKYLQNIETEKLILLGMFLGLSQVELKRCTAKELLRDLITWWMEKRHRVKEESGEPTWRSLAKALQDECVGLTGTSQDIQKDFSFSLD